MPEAGYTEIVERILEHPLIDVQLGAKVSFEELTAAGSLHVVWTGPLDGFFSHVHGRLGYRTVFWEETRVRGDFQGNAVLNYPSMDVPYTRIVEHKHFAPWEAHERSVVSYEFSKHTGEHDIPYYPLSTSADKETLRRYLADARQLRGVSFVGRLATYRYQNMDQVILDALELTDGISASGALPAFPPSMPL